MTLRLCILAAIAVILSPIGMMSACGVYHAGEGRWLSRDPLRRIDDSSLYRYSGNNPQANNDPTGLAAQHMPVRPPMTGGAQAPGMDLTACSVSIRWGLPSGYCRPTRLGPMDIWSSRLTDAECCRLGGNKWKNLEQGGQETHLGGFTMCCQGRTVVCMDDYPETLRGQYDDRLIDNLYYCLRAHEDVHVGDLDCSGVPGVEVYPLPWKNEGGGYCSEVRAYEETIRCLQTRGCRIRPGKDREPDPHGQREYQPITDEEMAAINRCNVDKGRLIEFYQGQLARFRALCEKERQR